MGRELRTGAGRTWKVNFYFLNLTEHICWNIEEYKWLVWKEMDYAMNSQHVQKKQWPTQKPDWQKYRFMWGEARGRLEKLWLGPKCRKLSLLIWRSWTSFHRPCETIWDFGRGSVWLLCSSGARTTGFAHRGQMMFYCYIAALVFLFLFSLFFLLAGCPELIIVLIPHFEWHCLSDWTRNRWDFNLGTCLVQTRKRRKGIRDKRGWRVVWY